MSNVIMVGRLDVAELAFYAFALFFFALVLYLRREDRREGYPIEDAVTGRVDSAWGPLTTSPIKRFKLPFNRGYATTPTIGREAVKIAARRIARFGGAPYQPTGNPLLDGVGPAAWVERSRLPDLDMEGHLRIIPMSHEPTFSIARGDRDPRGSTVIAADGAAVGKVAELWVDRSDRLIRYAEVALNSGRTAYVPVGMASFRPKRGVMIVDAINAAQFEEAPQIETPGSMSRYEEERMMAYFGGGYLYGLPGRTEPLL